MFLKSSHMRRDRRVSLLPLLSKERVGVRFRVSLMVAAACVGIPALAAAAPKDVPGAYRAAVDSVMSRKLMDAPGGKFDGDKPVTRYELAVVLDRLVRHIEQGRKPLHPAPRPKPPRISGSADPKVRAALSYLTANSFIPTNSILLQGSGSEPVTAKQLTVLLSQVTIAMTERVEPIYKD